MFSLAALTERSPSPVPAPKRVSPDPDNIDLGELARAPNFAANFGPPVYPLAAPRAESERVDPNAAGRTTPVVQIALVVGALLLAAGILATAVWSVHTPTPSPLTETLSKPETKTAANPAARSLAAPPPAAREDEALAAPPPSSAVSSGQPGSGESTSWRAQRPPRSPRPPVRSKPAARVTPEAPRPASPCAHCPPQDLACNIKCRAKG